MSNALRRIRKARFRHEQKTELELMQLAKCIRTPEDLERALAGIDHRDRAAIIARMKPYLSFEV